MTDLELADAATEEASHFTIYTKQLANAVKRLDAELKHSSTTGAELAKNNLRLEECRKEAMEITKRILDTDFNGMNNKRTYVEAAINWLGKWGKDE